MWWYQAMHAHMLKSLLPFKHLDEAMLLDAGCGTGGLLLKIQSMNRAWKLTGIDFSSVALEIAKTRARGVNFHEASITALPFPDCEFSAVVTADVLCQIENPGIALKEIFRVLKPGGSVSINVPAYMWMWSYHDEAVQSKHRFTRKEIESLLSSNGFEIQTTTHWNSILFPMIWAKRKLFYSKKDVSDVKVYPPTLERFFRIIMSLERMWLSSGHRWGWGISIFAVAQKPLE